MSTDKNNKSGFEDILERLRVALGLEYEYQVGEMIGIKKTALAQRKKRGSIPVDKIELVCQHKGINVNWVMSGGGAKHTSTALPPDAKPVRRIPVLGTVPAGFPEYAAEEVIGWVSRSDVPDNAYALRIKGDSMLPLEAGDYVVFIQNGDYQNSDIVVAHNEWGEFMVKRLRIRPDGSQLLTSDNPKYSPIEPNEHYRIVGKVIKAWRELI